jgi:hypothetical protein
MDPEEAYARQAIVHAAHQSLQSTSGSNTLDITDQSHGSGMASRTPDKTMDIRPVPQNDYSSGGKSGKKSTKKGGLKRLYNN